MPCQTAVIIKARNKLKEPEQGAPAGGLGLATAFLGLGVRDAALARAASKRAAAADAIPAASSVVVGVHSMAELCSRKMFDPAQEGWVVTSLLLGPRGSSMLLPVAPAIGLKLATTAESLGADAGLLTLRVFAFPAAVA